MLRRAAYKEVKEKEKVINVANASIRQRIKMKHNGLASRENMKRSKKRGAWVM